MKRLQHAVILLLGLSMAMMTSCTKDSDNGGNGNGNGGGNNGSYQDKIIGKWQATEHPCSIYDLTGTIVYEENYGVEDWEWFKFFSNGMVATDDDYWHKSNSLVPYLIEGNTLYIGFQYNLDDEDTFTIRELTNSSMTWEQERYRDGYWDDNEGLWIEGSYKRVEKTVFKKVN